MHTTPRPILKSFPAPPKLDGASIVSGDNMKTVPTPSYNPFPFASTSRIPPLDSPHVHFPPTPIMTKTATTHSRTTYDRRPIVVSPNICELPERGERDFGDPEEPEESYFQLPSPKSGRNFLPPDTTATCPDIQRGSTASSLPEISRSLRTRCHSHPDPLIRKPSTDFPSRVPLRHLRRHTDPYPNPNPLSVSRVPSLVSDHSSSDSDSDDPCLSPPLQATSGLPEQPHGHDKGIPHISLHFPGGLSTSPTFVPGLTPTEAEASMEVMSRPKRLKRRWSSRHHFQGHFEDSAVDAAHYPLGLDQETGGLGLKIISGDDAGLNTQVAGSDHCGFTGFYDRALEGCLGGF